MADTIKVPDPQEPPPGTLEGTTKLCPDCGSGFMGESHRDCKSGGGTLKKSPSSKSRLDDIPAEAQAVAEDPGRQLNQYLLVKQIGKGGMGAVWKAWDKKLTRWLAIKFLLVSEDEDVARFQREAKLAARLRHPNIAPIYEVGEAPAQAVGQPVRHYLAMEYIDGSSMASALDRPMQELLEIFVKVAQGVEAAHRAGVVHRDLKPQNVMLTSDGWPYVMDFGLAKALQAESSISVSGAVMGTPAYMPPEQAQGKLDEIDAQSDVYSLGATMYAVLCKKQAFTGQTPMEILMKVCKDDPPPPRSHNPELAPEVEKIILKAMAKEKAERYASSQALADDLKRFLSNEEIEAKGPSSLKLAAKKVKRNIWPVVVTLLILVAGGIIAYLALKPPPPAPTPPVVNNPNPVVNPNPDPLKPDPEAIAAKRAQAWFIAWAQLRDLLDYDDWKPGDATLASRAHQHLALLASDAPLREIDVRDWFERQTDKAETGVKEVGGTFEQKRDAATRIVKWCETIQAATKDVGPLKKAADSVGRTRSVAAGIADYKGKFTLKIFVAPYAEVKRITHQGKDIAVPQPVTPAVIGDLTIGDYEVELFHPQDGKRTEKLPASQFKDGKTYLLSGRMKDAKLKFVEAP